MASEATIARAIELDDDMPDDVCPGCGQNIAGWEDWRSHVPVTRDQAPKWMVSDHRRRGLLDAWPFTNDVNSHNKCPWDRDMLTARRFRRRLIHGR